LGDIYKKLLGHVQNQRTTTDIQLDPIEEEKISNLWRGFLTGRRQTNQNLPTLIWDCIAFPRLLVYLGSKSMAAPQCETMWLKSVTF